MLSILAPRMGVRRNPELAGSRRVGDTASRTRRENRVDGSSSS